MSSKKHRTVIDFDSFSKQFIEDRTSSLVSDVICCLLPAIWPGGKIDLQNLPELIKSPHDGFSKFVENELYLPPHLSLSLQQSAQIALFPSVLICMTFLELITSLYTGNVKSPNPRLFTSRFMGYDPGMTDLIYQLFRHTIAHYGISSGVIITKRDTDIPTANMIVKKGKHVGWVVDLGTPENHMILESRPTPAELIPGRNTPWAVKVDFRVNIEILKFLKDITASVYGPNGYFRALNSDANGKLRCNFGAVIKHLNPPRYSKDSDCWDAVTAE